MKTRKKKKIWEHREANVPEENIGSSWEEYLAPKLKDPEYRRKFEKRVAKMIVTQRLNRIKKEKHLSMRQLAKQMDSSLSQVQRLMKGENVSMDTLTRFAAATGKSLSIEFK